MGLHSPQEGITELPLAGQYKHYLAREEAWEKQAACIGLDTNLWFPEGRSNQPLDPMARKVCLGCPVKAECLDWALRTEQPWGAFGGMSEAHVQRLIRERRQGAETEVA